MTPPATSSFSPSSSNSPLAPDLVLRVGFAGKRQLDRAQTETVRNRLLDVFSVIGWRLVEISPLDDATNERPVPAIAKFYSHKRPTLRLIHGLCEGADSIAFELGDSPIQKSKITNPQSSISPDLPLIGSFQPPPAAPAQFASRVVRQSAVDWLFDPSSAASLPHNSPKTPKFPASRPTLGIS